MSLIMKMHKRQNEQYFFPSNLMIFEMLYPPFKVTWIQQVNNKLIRHLFPASNEHQSHLLHISNALRNSIFISEYRLLSRLSRDLDRRTKSAHLRAQPYSSSLLPLLWFTNHMNHSRKDYNATKLICATFHRSGQTSAQRALSSLSLHKLEYALTLGKCFECVHWAESDWTWELSHFKGLEQSERISVLGLHGAYTIPDKKLH